jgi:Cof subfamily protein (haloacid dehalogenase superfamily)
VPWRIGHAGAAPVSGAIRLVVSDLDGTLIRSDKTLSDGVVAAVGRLSHAGATVSLISARPPSGMLWVAERLALDGTIAAFNGGTILRTDGTILHRYVIPPAAARHSLEVLYQFPVTIWLFRGGFWHASSLEDPHTSREIASTNQQPVLVGDMAEFADSIDKIVAVTDDYALLARLEVQLRQALGTEANVVRSQPYYLDITAAQANKGDGISALAEAAGVPLAQTAAIGDQRNDLPMFARAGLAIAMGQGPEDVRLAASYVTLSSDEDGVADAINAILLSRVRACTH